MAGRKRSRASLNRHLYLRNGVWWTRIMRNGIEVRESTGCPESEVLAARNVRDKLIASLAERRAGLERLPDPLLLGELIALYMAEEAQPYDREKGGEQPGTKRSVEADLSSKKRILKHLDSGRSAAAIDREALLATARCVERESPTPAAGTRRKTFAFLRRVFSWGLECPSKTGLTKSPFGELSKSDRAKLFPRVAKRSYVYSPEELRKIYELLPAYLERFVRFAVHTGMRFNEVATLRWGAVDLARGRAIVEARFAKNKREREIALGLAAAEILTQLQPLSAAPTDYVFLGRGGSPIKSVRTGFDGAVSAVWKRSRPGERRPRFHDLRKTGATRVEAVSSHAVAKAFLGHADENVTDTYIVASLEAVREAVNRAARSIDGETPAGAIPFVATGLRTQTAQRTAQQPIREAKR